MCWSVPSTGSCCYQISRPWDEGGTPLASADESESLLAAIWREACQHIELAEAVARAHPHLAAALPVAQIAVRELDLSRGAIETIASAPGERGGERSRTDLHADELDAILAWSRGGGLERGAAGALRRRLPGLLP